ncbi:MAG: BamA/TamA family outer membrane protein [Deltaproteobacteria bacterium]
MRRFALVVALLAFSQLPPTADAAAPRRVWRTIVTPRCRVHYHEGTGALAARVSRIAERALSELSTMLGHAPNVPVHIVVTDETDDPNGFAQTLPQNVVTVFAGVPRAHETLGDYDDFMDLLVTHELVHIVHIDTVLGVPSWVNAVLGKTLVPNGVQPRWFIEGLATFLESRLTSGGRVKSTYIDLLVRTQVLADGFPEIDRLTHYTRTFPGSSYAWFLGGRFVDFIARRHGVEALREISLGYGARPIPYAINLVAERATGETFVELFDLWRAEEVARAHAVAARVAAEGPRLGSHVPNESPLVRFPRFARDGRLAVVASPRHDDEDLVVLAPDLVTARLRLRTSDGRGAFTADGARYVATIRDTIDQVYSHRDLEIIDVATGRRRRRTFGWRLQEPDVAPDGTIVAVAQEAGRTRLVTLSVDGEDDPATLGWLEEGEQVYDPRWSPDGSAVVASVRTDDDGGRNLVVFEGGRRRQLTDGPTRDSFPCWSADGRRIFFASDRGGVFNIHAVDVRSGVIERLTNVVSGALMPAAHPDGRRLLYVHGVATGWELRSIDLLDEPRAPLPDIPRFAVTATVSPAVYPDVAYDAWEALLPKAWLPAIAQDGVGDAVGLILSGEDALKQHLWSLTLRYGLSSERLGYAFDYTNRQTPYPLSISTALTTTNRPGRLAADTTFEDRLETIFRLNASVSFPMSFWDSGHAVGLSYGVETRRGVTLFDDDPFAPAPRSLGDLTLSSVAASWSFSNVRGFAESVSSVNGTALAVAMRMHSPTLGSDLRVFDVTAAATGYWPMPWARHHVLAARLALGAASGDTAGRAFFVLGGLPIRNVVTDALDGVGFGVDNLRGYERTALRGSTYYLGSLAYRLPLTSLTTGWFTLPLYFDRIHAEVFVDAGHAGNTIASPSVGVGAELRMDLAVAYVRPYTLRLGYGRGVSSSGIDNVYLVLGGSF